MTHVPLYLTAVDMSQLLAVDRSFCALTSFACEVLRDDLPLRRQFEARLLPLHYKEVMRDVMHRKRVESRVGILGFSSLPSSPVSCRPRIVSVAAGPLHSLLVSDKGCCYSFGCGDDGRLGLGTTTDALVPTQIHFSEPAHIVAVAAGGRHSLMIDSHGKLYACGHGPNIGSTSGDVIRPTQVPQPDAQRTVIWSAVSAGWGHCLLLSKDNKVFSLGIGLNGQLGLGSQHRSVSLPAAVVTCCGEDTIVMVAAGDAHSVFLTSSGDVFTCGLGDSGQLGRVVSSASGFIPQPLQPACLLVDHPSKRHCNDAAAPVPPHDTRCDGRDRVVSISAGATHTAVVCVDGRVVTYGRCHAVATASPLASSHRGGYIEPNLLLIPSNDVPTPMPRVGMTPTTNPSQRRHLLASDSSFTPISPVPQLSLLYGSTITPAESPPRRPHCELRSPTPASHFLAVTPPVLPPTTPTPVVFDPALRDKTLCAVDGLCAPSLHAVGVDASSLQPVHKPVSFPALPSHTPVHSSFDCPRPRRAHIRHVSSGKSHSMLLREDGCVFACGSGVHGKLGTGSHASVSAPAKVATTGVKFVDVACSSAHTVLLAEDGVVGASRCVETQFCCNCYCTCRDCGVQAYTCGFGKRGLLGQEYAVTSSVNTPLPITRFQ
jgi:alpha-tubulin suppressor-like RCC1 family protein